MIRSRRIGLAHSILGLFAVALLVQAARVQIVQGRQWRARAERQQTTDRVVPAERGEILDATHRVLAQSNSVVRLEIAPREVTDPRRLRLALSKLRVAPALIKRALDTSGKYLVLPGRFPAADAVMATSLRGVHSFALIERS